jgi:hypothetical protein
MRPIIDLKWQRDAEGYVLVKAEWKRDRTPESSKDPWKYTPLACARGYLLPEYKLLVDEAMRMPRRDDWWLEIHGKSGKNVPFQPFDGAPNLFRDFEEIQTPEQLLAFVNRNGLLMSKPLGARHLLEPRHGLRFAQIMHDLLVKRSGWIANGEPLISAGSERRLGRMEIVLRQASPREAPTLTFRPIQLIDGLFLQMSYALAGEHPPRACRQCGKLFEGRRLDAAYCSPQCKERWFSLERTRKKYRTKSGGTPATRPGRRR